MSTKTELKMNKTTFENKKKKVYIITTCHNKNILYRKLYH